MRLLDSGGSLERGRFLFDAGRYFEAHEAWEEVWLCASGLRRTLLQGLVQVAAACHKASRRESPGGCGRLLGAALVRIDAAGAQVPPELDLPRFRTSIVEFARGVEQWSRGGAPPAPESFPKIGRN